DGGTSADLHDGTPTDPDRVASVNPNVDPTGSVPSRNHSTRAGSTLAVNAVFLRTTPRGGAGGELGTRSWSRPITSSQTGAAPVTPLTFLIGSPVTLPTQTPTV